jgi:hypothetical protein
MSKALMQSLKMDLPALAELLRSKGRGRDTMLAHITPKEAALLKRRGGRGSINPDTGLPEFEDDFSYDIGFGPGEYTPQPTQESIEGTSFTPQEASMYGYSGDFSGQNVVLPGEAGDIPAFQPNEPGSQPLLQQSAESPTYGFPQIPTAQLPATIQSTPTPAELTALQKGGPQDPSIITPSGKEKEGLFGDASKYLAGALGAGALNAGRLATGTAVAGGLTAANLARTRQAQQQAQESKQELQALGTPYQAQGKELARAAQSGELNAANQQIVNAARAQANQAVATRGGVGAQQAQNSIADLTARLLQNQYDLGLKVMNIGDNYVSGAIKTGLQADQMINQANQQFYSSLAQMAAPFLLGQQPVYQVTTPRG